MAVPLDAGYRRCNNRECVALMMGLLVRLTRNLQKGFGNVCVSQIARCSTCDAAKSTPAKDWKRVEHRYVIDQDQKRRRNCAHRSRTLRRRVQRDIRATAKRRTGSEQRVHNIENVDQHGRKISVQTFPRSPSFWMPVPAGDVRFTISSSDSFAVSTDQADVTFTTTNWDTAQTVAVLPQSDTDGADEEETLTVSVDDDQNQ